MARIAFFTESLPPNGDDIGRFAWDLIHALAEQQHEIRVFSTFRDGEELPPSHPRIEIIRPFKKWGLLELPKIVPMLMAFRPDVLHLVQPHQEALGGFTNAMELLPSIKSLIGNPPLIASFFDIDAKNLRRHKLILSMARALTVSNQNQNDLVVTQIAGRSSPQIVIVPMGFARAPFVRGESAYQDILINDGPEAQALEKLRERYPKLIAVAGPLDSHDSVAQTFTTLAKILTADASASVAVLDGWGRIPIRTRHLCEQILVDADVAHRVLLTGPLNERDLIDFLESARCVLVAPINESRLAFTKLLRDAQRANSALVLSEEQAAIDAVGWKDGVNSLICPRDPQKLADAVLRLLQDSTLRDRLRTEAAEISRIEVADQPGNIVSRLYVKILTS